MTKKNLEKELAKISKVYLGIEDHGILTMSISFVGADGGWGQGYGGHCFGHHDRNSDEFIGHPIGAEMIHALLDTFKVDTLEALKGKYCWVFRERNVGNARIEYIQALGEIGGGIYDEQAVVDRCIQRMKTHGMNLWKSKDD